MKTFKQVLPTMPWHAVFILIVTKSAIVVASSSAKHATLLLPSGRFEEIRSSSKESVAKPTHRRKPTPPTSLMRVGSARRNQSTQNSVKITGDIMDREWATLCTAPQEMLEEEGLWECLSGGFCVRAEARCNSVDNCPDGSDEAGCENHARSRSFNCIGTWCTFLFILSSALSRSLPI
mmetsp:Transcript_93776/g.148073  ORF Transcript_93776/g.148073 Transcript_93776/m.148073 type:complete len:178 (-) Transcript_93776:52-585(-)